MAYTKYHFVGDPSTIWDDCSGSRKRHRDEEENDCIVRVYNNIDICAHATGGDGGDGAEGGDNNSSAAAAASRGGVGVAVPVTVDVDEENLNRNRNICPFSVPDNGVDGDSEELVEDLQVPPNGNSSGSELDTVAIAASGNGGDGGNGGDVKQSIYAKIDNWTVVVCGNEKEFRRGITMSTDGSDVDLRMEDDDIFINGEKMAVEELKDGTKVFVFKKSKESNE